MLKQQFMTYADKQPHYYPKLEDIKPQIWYEITISPAVQFRSDNDRIRMSYQNMITNILTKLHAKIDLFTELSKESQNVHYHGKIKWDKEADIVEFYLELKDIKEDCTIAINNYRTLDGLQDDDTNWECYCRKQYPLLRAYQNTQSNTPIHIRQ